MSDFERKLKETDTIVGLVTYNTWEAFKVNVVKFANQERPLPYKTFNLSLYGGDVDITKAYKAIDSLHGKLLGHDRSKYSDEYLYLLSDEENVGPIIFEVEIEKRKGTVDSINFTFYGISEPDESIFDPFYEIGFHKEEEEDDKASVWFGSFGRDGYVQTTHKQFEPLPLADIVANYTPEVVEQVKELLELLKLATSGIVIIRGPVGTGKTHLIRALISELKGIRRPVVCTPPLAFLQEPMKVHEAMLNHENPLVIFEDLGELFREDAKSVYADHFSNLANMTDGLLSILDSSVFLLTFNYDITDIDPALIRGGRCIMDLYVPRLPMEQAVKLLPEGTEVPPDAVDLSLAEIYNLKGGKVAQIRGKGGVGFRSNRTYPPRGRNY